MSESSPKTEGGLGPGESQRAPGPSIDLGSILANRYELCSILGEGGMAMVYAAHDQLLDRMVAVKLLRPVYAASEELMERFIREAQSLAALDSPHIVPIYDVYRHEEVAFIVMKILRAPTLHQLVRRHGPLEEKRVVKIISQVLEALSRIHALGLVHRDIKPANIVVDEGDTVTVLDLGIVADSSSTGVTVEQLVVGTPAFMAPEQALNRPIDARTDIYSTGVTLFECLTGDLPFGDEASVATCLRHVQKKPPCIRSLVPEVSEGLSAVVRRALAKRPEERYPSASAMRYALRARAANENDPTESEKNMNPVQTSDVEREWYSEQETQDCEYETTSVIRHLEHDVRRRQLRIGMLVGASLGLCMALYLSARSSNQDAKSSSAESPVLERKALLRAEPQQPGPIPSSAPAPAATEVAPIADPATEVEPAADPATEVEPAADLVAEVVDDTPLNDKTQTSEPPNPSASEVESPVMAPKADAAKVSKTAKPRKAGKRVAAKPAPQVQEPKASVSALQDEVRRYPKRAAAYHRLGDGYRRAGNRVAAIAAYRRFLALAPNASGAKSVRQKLKGLGGL